MFSLDTDGRLVIFKHFQRNKSFSWDEEFFLSEILSSDSRKNDVYWATIALRDCGTELSVPALKALSTYSMQDVQACAILTIAQIAGGQETPYYIERLTDPKSGRNKVFALWAIGVFGDERALPTVEQYARKNKRKLSSTDMDPRPHQEILAFLHRMKAFDLLTELSFLAPPLRSLTPFALGNFIKRLPGIELMVDIPNA